MKKHYAFPAVFTEEESGISIEFPDLPGCFSCADDWQEAIKNAKSVLKLHLIGSLRDEEEIPAPSDFEDIKRNKDDVLVLIETQI